MLPNTRQVAKIQGSIYYFTGKPCLNGHIDKRQTSNGNCTECDKVRESAKESKKRYMKRNPIRVVKNIENKRRIAREWAKRNRSNQNFHTARYRALKIKATPNWLSDEQLNKIKEIYSNCPKGYHVDHIIPLRGEFVCGLHVPWNLQHLPAKDNISKGNRVISH